MNSNLIEEIIELIELETKNAGTPFKNDVDFKIVYQPKHHTPLKLEKGYMAVYSFVYKGEFLKIGQAGKSSNARYQSQHYLTFRNRGDASTLSRRLVDDINNQSLGLNDNNVGQWVKDNCERYDVLIDAKYGKITLNFLEGLLQFKYHPKYEGQ